MDVLFDKHDTLSPAAGRVVGVVLNANVWTTFDYLWPAGLGEPAVGRRVQVPFGRGNRGSVAFVVEVDRPRPAMALKAVTAALDDAPSLDATLMRLGQWMSHYYMTPLGMVLAAMVPSSVGQHAPKHETVASLTSGPDDWPKNLGPKQRKLLDALQEARKQGIDSVPLEQLFSHGGDRQTARTLEARQLIRLASRPVQLPALADATPEDALELNDEQAAALAAIEANLAPAGAADKFSVTLLQGVTGSGKTEVYVRAARAVIAAGKQAMLLVPEIALATQTLERLLTRLPRVAVLHSGLTGAQRAFYWHNIAAGEAAVVVGPRSAIFAPLPKLGLIIVDEEHEASYKQDTAPRYHGRDTAVMRGRLAGVPVVLGSATPSLESLVNAQQGRYAWVKLSRRVRNLPMPRLNIVPLRKELSPGKIELIGATLTRKIAAALDRREQVILLMNRRGYASYVFCPACEWQLQCDACTRAMVFHQATQLASCHYCQRSALLPQICPACKGKIVLFGYGIQRIEGELLRKFPTLDRRMARIDSDTMTTPAQFRNVFDEFSRGDLDLLLGTQMVAKGLDFPRVSLVGVVSADTSLTIPDFRAAERTFQLVVQVAGRAGRADLPGEVVVQTLHEDEPAIRFAATHDFDGFAATELPLRHDANLPPFGRMVRFIIRHAHVGLAEQGSRTLATALGRTLPQDIRMTGPMPAGVQKIRNLFRYQLLLTASRAGYIQQVISPRLAELTKDIEAEVIADVDPVNLL
ncbi:MAG: primosomal protein N' [Phycisphaerae bacterium]|nr:primosomal protein N' [Phycisphaerae bacterium]